MDTGAVMNNGIAGLRDHLGIFKGDVGFWSRAYFFWLRLRAHNNNFWVGREFKLKTIARAGLIMRELELKRATANWN